MGKITMTVRADSHPEYGNIADFRLMLNGGSCTVSWGDGTTTTHHAEGEGQHIRHTYPEECIETGKTFVITISSDEDNIVGISINDEFTYMDVKDIDISGCQSLRYFALLSASTEHFDLRTNPGITKVTLQGDFCGIADFSNSTELKELSFCHTGGRSEKVKKLNLARCDKLEYLECRYAYDLTHIAISNRSALKKLVYNDNTPLSEKSLEIIRRIITGNGGVIEYDDTEKFWN